MAIVVGSSVAFFLWSLSAVTEFRKGHPWLLWLLPAAGALIGLVYWKWGQVADAGTRLIIDEIHQPGGGIPARMAPLVLAGTLVTHLFGGSAGREGTAVQMGGSIASALEQRVLPHLRWKFLQFGAVERRELLQAGIAAGFGAVFGTPLTGAIFSIEVLKVRRFGLIAVLPCLLAAYVGHWTVGAWGVHHTRYPQIVLAQFGLPSLDAATMTKVALGGVAFGIAAWIFITCAHNVGALARRFISTPWLRPVVGGCVVVALTLLLGTREYLGLGVTNPPGDVSIVASFVAGGADRFSWLYKIAFTTITVGSGFKGGEVTPLFFVGATMGNTVATLLHAPVALFAALGFVAVFGASANTPIACTMMGLELFGVDAVFYFALSCGLAFLCSGRKGLYTASAVATPGPAHASENETSPSHPPAGKP